MIKYCIAYKTRVKLTVYNSEGEEIQKLVDEEKYPGTYEIEFCVTQDSSPAMKERTYFYVLEATPIGGQAVDYKSEKKMQLTK